MRKHPLSIGCVAVGTALLGMALVGATSRATARTVGKVTAYKQEVHRPGEKAERTYFVASGASEAEMLEFREELMRLGARHVNFFVPDVVVCEMPRNANILADVRVPAVTRHEEYALDTQPVLGVSAASADRIAAVRSAYELSERVSRSSLPSPTQAPAFKDVVLRHTPDRVEEVKRKLMQIDGSAAQEERRLDQNSEFLSGNILAIFVLPESNGLRDPNTHDWTDQEVAQATAGAASAMLAFQSTWPNLPMHFVFKSYDKVTCTYEPILHNMNDDANTWIIDTMRSLGYGQSGDASAAAHRWNNDHRAQYRTDWVFTGFIANSKHAPGNIFLGADYTAYAFLGGPYLIMPHPAGTDWNDIGEALVFSQIYQHESGHSFWALDEYAAAANECRNASGYLAYENWNADIQGPTGTSSCSEPLDCIMKYAARQDIGRPWCFYTAGQTGVIDADEDDVPDIFQRRPRVQFVSPSVDTVETSEVTIQLRVISDPVPNQNPLQADDYRMDYALPLGGGRYVHPKGLEELLLKPVDGRWDEVEEEVEFTVTNLPVGRSRIALEFENALGYESHDPRKNNPYVMEVSYLGVNFFQFNLIVKRTSIIASWGIINDEFGSTFDLHRIDPDGSDILLAENVPPSGDPKNGIVPYRYIDKDIQPGTDYVYYVRSSFTVPVDGAPKEFNPESPRLTQTAMVPVYTKGFMSLAAPNPFRPASDVTTKVSLVVPPSFAAASDVQGAPQTRVATQLEVAVFDVSGRRIKMLHTGGVQLDVITLKWDGTNDANQAVPTGVYFVRAKANDQRSSQKILLIK